MLVLVKERNSMHCNTKLIKRGNNSRTYKLNVIHKKMEAKKKCIDTRVVFSAINSHYERVWSVDSLTKKAAPLLYNNRRK